MVASDGSAIHCNVSDVCATRKTVTLQCGVTLFHDNMLQIMVPYYTGMHRVDEYTLVDSSSGGRIDVDACDDLVRLTAPDEINRQHRIMKKLRQDQEDIFTDEEATSESLY